MVPEECSGSGVGEGQGPFGGNGCGELLLFLPPHSFLLYPFLQALELLLKNGAGKRAAGAGRRGDCRGVEPLKVRGEHLLQIVLAPLL